MWTMRWPVLAYTTPHQVILSKDRFLFIIFFPLNSTLTFDHCSKPPVTLARKPSLSLSNLATHTTIVILSHSLAQSTQEKIRAHCLEKRNWRSVPEEGILQQRKGDWFAHVATNLGACWNKTEPLDLLPLSITRFSSQFWNFRIRVYIWVITCKQCRLGLLMPTEHANESRRSRKLIINCHIRFSTSQI